MTLGIRARLFLVSLALILAVVLLSGLYLGRSLRGSLEAGIEAELWRLAAAAVELVEGARAGGEDLQEAAGRIGETLGVRTTIIGPGGEVLGESDVPAAELAGVDNHGARPEVVAARERGRGLSRRFSTTVDSDMLYCALAVPGDRGVVRVARPLADVDAAVQRVYLILFFAGLLGIAAAVLLAGIASHVMSRTLRRLVDGARALVRARGEESARLEVPDEGDLAGLAGSLTELAAELERSLGTLAAERALVAAVLEGMSDGVIALDDRHRVTLMNRAACALLGLDPGEIPRRRSLLELLRAPELQVLLESKGGEEGASEFDVPGVERRVLARVTTLRGGGLVLVLGDVTTLRRLETVRRDFVANVSHELRTPVSVVRANLETLADGALADEEHAPRLVEAALRNAERLARILADLLDLARLEAGRYELDAVEVDLDAVARRAIESIEREVTLEVAPDLAARADEKALEQVLFNLVDNAAKYSPADADIRVVARARGGAARIEVRDTGPGIPPAHRSRIFERFYRVDPGRSREMGGTGLGLSIVKHLVEAMHGRVGVEPNDPRGTVFWFELPRAASITPGDP